MVEGQWAEKQGQGVGLGRRQSMNKGLRSHCAFRVLYGNITLLQVFIFWSPTEILGEPRVYSEISFESSITKH